MKSEDAVKKIYPGAHCAPLAHAMYPEFYVIRANSAEWAESLGKGQTPGDAWRNARNGLPHGYEERMEDHLEDWSENQSG